MEIKVAIKDGWREAEVCVVPLTYSTLLKTRNFDPKNSEFYIIAKEHTDWEGLIEFWWVDENTLGWHCLSGGHIQKATPEWLYEREKNWEQGTHIAIVKQLKGKVAPIYINEAIDKIFWRWKNAER